MKENIEIKHYQKDIKNDTRQEKEPVISQMTMHKDPSNKTIEDSFKLENDGYVIKDFKTNKFYLLGEWVDDPNRAMKFRNSDDANFVCDDIRRKKNNKNERIFDSVYPCQLRPGVSDDDGYIIKDTTSGTQYVLKLEGEYNSKFTTDPNKAKVYPSPMMAEDYIDAYRFCGGKTEFLSVVRKRDEVKDNARIKYYYEHKERWWRKQPDKVKSVLLGYIIKDPVLGKYYRNSKKGFSYINWTNDRNDAMIFATREDAVKCPATRNISVSFEPYYEKISIPNNSDSKQSKKNDYGKNEIVESLKRLKELYDILIEEKINNEINLSKVKDKIDDMINFSKKYNFYDDLKSVFDIDGWTPKDI